MFTDDGLAGIILTIRLDIGQNLAATSHTGTHTGCHASRSTQTAIIFSRVCDS